MTLDLFQLPPRKDYTEPEIQELWTMVDSFERWGPAAFYASHSAAEALHQGQPYRAVLALGEIVGARLCSVCGMDQCRQLHPLSVRRWVPRLPQLGQLDLNNPAGQLVELMTAVPVPLRYLVIPKLRHQLVHQWLMAGDWPQLDLRRPLMAAVADWSQLLLRARHGAITSGLISDQQKAG